MISVAEAYKRIHENLPGWGEPRTAFDLVADRDYPPFHRVMMDGIAVSFDVWKEGRRTFPVAGISPAGEPQKILSDHGSCLEIMTGAPLPQGATLVIPYEHLVIENGVARITVETERTHFENIHVAGSDARKGEVLLKAGEVINGPHTGIAASVGSQITTEELRINIISTGDELVEVHETPLAHQIRRSNAHALKASLNLFGFLSVELSHLPDETEAIEAHYKKARENFDLLLYSGGVSKGKFDYLPETWKKLGVKEILHGVSQRPGKPLWFGVDDLTKTTVVGLPGNPVSSLVCLHRYLLSRKDIYAELASEIRFDKDLTYFQPVKIEFTRSGKMIAHPLKIKNSGEFSALAGSDGFLELPKELKVFPAGEAFLFHPWRPM